MKVAVLGLGEAGGRIAADLSAAGVDVQGFDPAHGGGSAVEAVRGAEFVLSVNAASVALDVARGVAEALEPGAVYADLNTAAPDLKRELASLVPLFADVALVGVVPATGLKTAALASGDGAERFAAAFRPLGMPVTVVGDAAGLKLLRSVFMKGIAAAAIEAVESARAAGVEQHVRDDIAGVIGDELLERLLTGSKQHATRRTEEMLAAAAYVEQLGVEPRIASAAAGWLAELRDGPWEWPDSLDALVAAPETHTLLFENSDVRVLEMRIAPGDTTAVHTHRWPGILYVHSFDHFVRRGGDGNVLVDTREAGTPPLAGTAVWSPALPPHSLENVGTAEIRVIGVELKR